MLGLPLPSGLLSASLVERPFCTVLERFSVCLVNTDGLPSAEAPGVPFCFLVWPPFAGESDAVAPDESSVLSLALGEFLPCVASLCLRFSASRIAARGGYSLLVSSFLVAVCI